jgi:hypothetical protein
MSPHYGRETVQRYPNQGTLARRLLYFHLIDPKMKARLADLGGTVLSGSPADFGKLLTEEVDKWSKVVKASGAKPE